MYERRPSVTYGLIAVNFIVWLMVNIFFTSRVQLSNFLSTFGVVPILLLNGQYLHSLVTYMFIHVDLIHILLNMYALFLFGRDVETDVGSGRFLTVYLLSGVTAALFHIFYFAWFLSLECSPFVRPISPACFIPSIGASGAIFGIMGSYLLFFPHRRLYAFLWFIPVVAPAYVVILSFIFIQTVFMLTTPFSTVAYTAHVGGFIAGLLLSIPLRKRRPPEWYYYE
ncbi:MAG: rhomboid family intramembrane serine protease [Candidatus Caldarchaeum sp.]|uniref:Rhomboid family intramembrane serine protease n=1 Tax=Caldiarchaeum subterraneum TaxID=311458 RepID=A0A7C5QQU7_CALS0